MNPITIELTPHEQRIAEYIGRERHRNNEACGVADQRVGPQSSEQIHVNGFGAELAFCKLFNVYPDFEIGPRRGSVDCWRFNEAIDVKATERPRGRLLALPRKRELAADWYALIIVAWPVFQFAGFAHARELLDDAHLTDLGHGPTYALEQTALHLAQRIPK